MNTKIIASILGSCSLLILLASGALAQQRTFVSGVGSDSSPCTRTAPCRTFGKAISLTTSGGEVIVLDSAGYGTFSITGTVSIISPPGVYAGVSALSGDGIDINASASDTVTLRGLTLNNQTGGAGGIVLNSAGTLHVENCVINGFNTPGFGGIQFLGPGSLEVKDSILAGNYYGIFVKPSSGIALTTIDHVRLEGGTFGLVAREGSVVAVRNSVASANSDIGFDADSEASGSVRLTLEACVASNNGNFGIAALSGATGPADVDVENCATSGNLAGINAFSASTGVVTVRLSNSTVTGNSIGITNNGSPALFLSRGNNTVERNTINTGGTIGSYTAK
jgi:hypothetical protein